MDKPLTHFVPAIVVLALTLAPDSAVLPPSADTPAEAGPLALAAELEAMIPQMCVSCSSCGKNSHKHGNQPVLKGGRSTYHPHPCLEGGGCEYHPSCGMGGEAIAVAADLIDSLKGGTPEQLALLAKHYAHMVKINKDRRALQLVGCNTRVIASYSSKTIPALEALLQTAT